MPTRFRRAVESRVQGRRINFEVSPELEQKLDKLVRQTGSASVSELLRRSIVLMEVAADAKQKGEKIVIADQDRKPIAEVLI